MKYAYSIDVVLRPVSLPAPPPADLVVEGPPEVVLVGLSKASVGFKLRNLGAAPVTFSASPSVSKEGAWKDKVGVSVRFDSFTVPASGFFDNFLDVEAHEAPPAEERVKVTVSAEVP